MKPSTTPSKQHLSLRLHKPILLIFISLILTLVVGTLLTYYHEIGLHTAPRIIKPTATPIIIKPTATPAIKPTARISVVEKIPSSGIVVTDSLASPALGGQMRSIVVYLPPTYKTHIGQSKRYPVLYLLHGSPGEAHDWITTGKANQSADALITSGKIPELIMVLPDGNGQSWDPSEWGNSYDKSQLMESYVVNDLVNYIDLKYRTIPDAANRGIGGLSMGGFGAMNIAIHHPDIFGSVISLGGYYYAEGSLWGNNVSYMQQNSPADELPSDKQAWKLHLFLGAGTQDEPYFTDAQQFARELDGIHIPYHFDVQQGYHSWIVWQTQMYNALLWLHWIPVKVPGNITNLN